MATPPPVLEVSTIGLNYFTIDGMPNAEFFKKLFNKDIRACLSVTDNWLRSPPVSLDPSCQQRQCHALLCPSSFTSASLIFGASFFFLNDFANLA